MFISLRITEVSTLHSLKLQHICKKKRTSGLNKFLPGHDSSRRVTRGLKVTSIMDFHKPPTVHSFLAVTTWCFLTILVSIWRFLSPCWSAYNIAWYMLIYNNETSCVEGNALSMRALFDHVTTIGESRLKELCWNLFA